MTQSQGPQTTLLNYFVFNRNATPDRIWHELEKQQVLKNSKKLYRKIETALDGYHEVEHPTHDVVVKELRDILQDDHITMQILFEVLAQIVNEDWSSDGDQDHMDQDSHIHASLTIVKALCSIYPQVAFEEIQAQEGKADLGGGYTPFEVASKKGYTKFVQVMSDELANYNRANSNRKTNGGPATREDFYVRRKDSLRKGKDAAQKYNHRLVIRTDAKTAFGLAAENLRLGVLKLLLQHEAYKDEKLADVKSLKVAIRRTAAKASPSQAFEGLEGKTFDGPDLEAFKFILERTQLTEDNYTEIWTEAVTKKSEGIIQYLLGTKSAKFATHRSAQIVIQKGTPEMWTLYSNSVGDRLRSILEQGHLLHTAVEYLQADIVKAILAAFCSLIEVARVRIDPTGAEHLEYAIELLTKKPEPADLQAGSSYIEIRNALLKAMIRSSSSDLGIKEIKSILRRAKVDVNGMCLHLSNVNTGEQSFTDYVEWLQAQDDNQSKIFKFESILKYAKFPDLNTQTSNQTHDVASYMRGTHSEIRMMFEWLRKRGVTEVLQVSVPDRLFCPHSDDDIAKCVDGFAVRVLKWRKLDLYLGSIKEKEHLRELHLYSSGNPSVHDQWCRELPKFPRLKRLYVYVVTSILSNERVQMVKMDLQSRLEKLRPRRDADPNSQSGSCRAIRKISVAEFDWAMDIKGKVYRNLDEITNDVVGSNLSAFIDKYRSAMAARRAMGQKSTMTRIALIDSGVVIVGGKRSGHGKSRGCNPNDRNSESGADRYGNYQISRPSYSSSNSGWQQFGRDEETANDHEGQYRTTQAGLTDDLAIRVEAGKSFVTTGDNEEQVWWHASEPHGTQMARLICSVDPWCKLLIAKVAETRRPGISADLVAEAIDWAVDQKVDVISLSLVTYPASQSMRDAIQRAEARDIVILSSSVDEGFKEVKDTLQQSNVKHNVLTIAACDQWGNLLDRSQKSGYDYCFMGNDVKVGQVPFLKSPESISGSSVATAIAAGVVSLIIAFCRLASEDRPMGDRWRRSMAERKLKDMAETDHKFVVLEHLCGRKKELKNADFMTEVKSSFKY